MNVSSIVVQTTADRVEGIVEVLKNSPLCDYHLHDEKGRIVITVEGAGTDEEIQKLKEVKMIEGVISAEMMYSYSEDELTSLRDDIDSSGVTPEWLNQDVRAQDIRYQGDLKKKDI